jgi:hypothetical protein
MTVKKATEIPTIDVSLVSIQAKDSTDEYILDTASTIEIEPQVEETDAVKLIVKGVLKAQKPMISVLTGNQITLTDNVFTPEIVKIMQGGTIHYWANEAHTSESDEPTEYGISGYTPPTVGSSDKGQTFTLNAYSAQYNAAGQIVQYEKIMYPNCTGVPVAFGSEDDSFRAPEYTINSAPNNGEAPYDIDYVDALPIETE